jgi:hypothetical protein
LNVPRKDWGKVLDAAEALEKARNSISAAKSNQAGVAGLQARLTGLGSEAGLNLQSELFQNAVDVAKESASGFTGYELPNVTGEAYPWRAETQEPAAVADPAPAPSLFERIFGGGENAVAPSQPSTQITPQPGVPFRATPPSASAAPMATADPGAKVQTPINPESGAPYPTFNRQADGDRATPRGEIYIIWEDGVPIGYRSKGPGR